MLANPTPPATLFGFACQFRMPNLHPPHGWERLRRRAFLFSARVSCLPQRGASPAWSQAAFPNLDVETASQVDRVRTGKALEACLHFCGNRGPLIRLTEEVGRPFSNSLKLIKRLAELRRLSLEMKSH